MQQEDIQLVLFKSQRKCNIIITYDDEDTLGSDSDNSFDINEYNGPVTRNISKILQNVDTKPKKTKTETEAETEAKAEETVEDPKEKSKKPKKPVDYYTNDEYDYYKKLKKSKKQKLDQLENTICDLNEIKIPLRFKILESDMDIRLKAIAVTKLDQMAQMEYKSSDYYKQYHWIENLAKLPVGKYKDLPKLADTSAISQFLDNIMKNLDADVYGHKIAKDQIIRLLAKWISNSSAKGLVIGLHGPPGVAKTTLAMSICKSLDLPYSFFSLCSINDVNALVGFSPTYESSRWGLISDALMRSKCCNPVMFFDELDKVGKTRHGEEVSNMLVHLTDHSQNHLYEDRFFPDIPLDLSRCLMIFSYNNEELINPILKDRMVTIHASGYSRSDKIKIAQDHLIPKIFEEFAIDQILFSKDILGFIITLTEEEQGVRNLKRCLEEIISQINLNKLLEKEILGEKITFPFEITQEIVSLFVKEKKSNISLPMMYI